MVNHSLFLDTPCSRTPGSAGFFLAYPLLLLFKSLCQTPFLLLTSKCWRAQSSIHQPPHFSVRIYLASIMALNTIPKLMTPTVIGPALTLLLNSKLLDDS